MNNVVGSLSENHVTRPFKSGLTWFFLVLMFLFFLGFFAFVVNAANVSQTNSNDGSADNGTLTRTVTFTGTDFATGSQINNVTAAVNFEKIDGTCPTHAGGAPYNREIYAYLTSPNSTQVTLIEDISNNGGSGTGTTYSSNVTYGGNVTVTFDDNAALAVGGTAPTTGTYRPVQSLSAFDGEDPLGVWTLTLGDSAPDQPLCFYEFTLEIDADQPPTMADQSFDIAENSSNGTVVGTVVATDSDPSEKLTFSITGGTGVGTFDINTTTGVITVTNGAVLDYETPPTSYTLDVKVTDSAILTDTATMTINVTQANDAPTDIALSNNSVTEHLPAGTAVGTLSTTDEDAGESFTYALVSGAGDSGNASFSIDGDGLKTAVELDRDIQTSYSIRVRSTDSGGKSVEKQFTINIDNGNDPPTDIALSNSSVTENQPTGTAVGTFTATDQNGADTHTYALVAGSGDTDNGAFQIVGDELQTNAVFDFETKSSYSIRVRVTDNGGLTFEESFTIMVTDANEPPTDIALSSNSVAEGQPTGTAVGTFSTTDLDSASHTYTLVAGTGDDNNADFQIVGDELQTNAVFDFETKSSYTIRVQTDDGGGGTYAEAFAITITDGNDPPTVLSLDSTNVDEHQPTGTNVGTFSSTDPDLPGDSHTYTLVSGIGSTDNASFTITGSTLKTAAEFDFETKAGYDIRVRTTDSGSLYTEQTFTITVNNGNDPPTDITLSNNTVVENQAGTAVGNLTSTDNGGDTHTYSLVSGTGSTHNSAFQIVGGILKTATGLDAEGVGNYSIRIRSTDNGGLYFDKIFTVTATDANDAPTNINISNSTILESQPISSTVGTLTSVDQDSGDTHSYTLVAGSGSTDNASFDVIGDELRTKIALDFETKSSYSVRIQTDDSNGGTFAKQFTITVGDDNDAPTNIMIDDNEVAENETIGSLVGYFDSEDTDSGDTHSYSLVSGTGDTDNGKFLIGGSALQTAVSFNYETPPTSFSIRVQSDDGNGGTFAKVFTINVTNVNEKPTAVADSGDSTDEDTLLTVNAAAGVITNDTDPDAGDTLTVLSHDAASSSGAAVSVAANGSFSYDPTASATLQALKVGDSVNDTFDYVVQDSGGLTDSGTVTIAVSGVNDDPSANSDSAFTPTNTPVVISVLTNDTDPENDTLSVSAVTQGAHGTVTNHGDGTVTYAPDAGYRGSDSFTYSISDGQGGTDTGTVTMSVGLTKVYIPLLFNNFQTAPDLVVTELNASSNVIEVVVTNQGNQATNSGFWVDFYVNPDPVPTHENQTWSDVADEGIVWGVTAGLAPGETLTLTYSTDPAAPNLYYSAANSNYSGSLVPGTAVYAQVDSVHLGTSYGGILELHEIYGNPYNNIKGSTAVAN